MIEKEMAEKNLIFKAIVGSKLYGTLGPNSDTDYMGCCLPNIEYVCGIKRFEQYESKTNPADSRTPNAKSDVDATIYSLPKLIHILKENNPTALELLFVPDNCKVFTSQPWDAILDNKAAFISKKAKHTFIGYAFAQKQKVLNKRDRYSQFVTALVKLDEYKKSGMNTLPERLELNTDLIKAGQWAAFEKGQSIHDVGNRIIKEVEKYGFRIDNVREHGYDGKFISHVYRLLSEGLELLVEGNITLPLNEVKTVRAIKDYETSLDETLKMIDAKEHLVEEAYIRSPLPNTPDLELINALQIDILYGFWKRQELHVYEGCHMYDSVLDLYH